MTKELVWYNGELRDATPDDDEDDEDDE